jgi:hypothetical protein
VTPNNLILSYLISPPLVEFFDAQVEGLHIEQRGRALAQRKVGIRQGGLSSSGPNGEVGQGRSDHARPRGAQLTRTSKLFVMMVTILRDR